MKKENLRIWNNLVNQLVVITPIIHLPAFIHQLKNELNNANESFAFSRDWLMWFLLMITPTNMNRSNLSEFSDLYEILFKEDEILAIPDLSSFLAVVKFAALSIWIQFSLKLSNQDSSQTNNNSTSKVTKIGTIPELLKNQYNFLQESLTMQNFQEFGMSVCLNACKKSNHIKFI